MCICGYQGLIKDFITGRALPDTGDEEVRQAVERLLMTEKGYRSEDIVLDRLIVLAVGDFRESGRAELVVLVGGRPFMAIKSARGSVVTREREALAASRLAYDRPVPFTVVTNGREAEMLDTLTGRVVGEGWAAIPDRDAAGKMIPVRETAVLSDRQRELETRVYLGYLALERAQACPLALAELENKRTEPDPFRDGAPKTRR